MPTPAIGEHMTLPDENDMDFGSYQEVPYVPHRKGPKNRFVGGFISTLKKFPGFGKRKRLRRRSYENVQAPSPIPESQLEEEEEEAELEDERVATSMPSPAGPPPELEPEPERSVASRVQSPDPAVHMPEPSLPSYPATRVHSGNLSSIGTLAMGPDPIPIQRSAAPSPAALRHAFDMMEEDDDRSLSEDDDNVHMPYVSPPRTSTPVHRHRHPRPPTPAPAPFPQPRPREPSYDPVIPPLIATTGPSQTITSNSRLYDPSGHAHFSHNTTFLSQLSRFKRFIRDIDQLPFSSADQIADEYVPSQTHRSRTREQKRGHMMSSSSWYNSREPIPQAYFYATPGFGAVPALDAIPPPVHKPPAWNPQWDAWAGAHLWDTMPPSGAPGGAPGMVELNPGLAPSVPHGYGSDRQPVFVYPSVVPSRW